MASVDVLVRGAGPVGCTLALALRGSPLSVAIVDSGPPASGFRPLALSYGSRLILERLRIWPQLEPTPIETIVASQRGSFGRTLLTAADAGVPALGYVVEYAALASALRAGLQIGSSEPEAGCIVHAEGSADLPEGKRYAQDALVGVVETAPGASSTAFERFTEEGPLALLPHAGRYAVIWSMRPQRAQELAAAPAEEFLAALAAAAGSAIGRPRAVTMRAVQPLALKVRRVRAAGREVYIGNAAQTLHPVAGQGLNLGLRDAWDLAQHLVRAAPPGDAQLSRFAAQRQLDARATIALTDFLAAAFTGANPLARLARGAALSMLDVLPAPRRFFARRMIFGAGALP